jgi:hypothetical protein
LNDDEARYLIDQFNKYASWTSKDLSADLSLAVLALATIGVAVSIIGLPSETLGIFLGFLLLALLVTFFCYVVTRSREHDRNKMKLIVLEKHRFRYKSLPDDATFVKILASKPEEIEKLLETHEH